MSGSATALFQAAASLVSKVQCGNITHVVPFPKLLLGKFVKVNSGALVGPPKVYNGICRLNTA